MGLYVKSHKGTYRGVENKVKLNIKLAINQSITLQAVVYFPTKDNYATVLTLLRLLQH
jgi:hypothetical protein